MQKNAYHVTFPNNIQMIQKHGLLPYDEYVFVTTNPKAASVIAHHHLKSNNGEAIAVATVDITENVERGEVFVEHNALFDRPDYLMVKSAIKPEQIKKFDIIAVEYKPVNEADVFDLAAQTNDYIVRCVNHNETFAPYRNPEPFKG